MQKLVRNLPEPSELSSNWRSVKRRSQQTSSSCIKSWFNDELVLLMWTSCNHKFSNNKIKNQTRPSLRWRRSATWVERTWCTCRQQSWAWSSRVITGSMFPRPPATASRRCLTTPTSAHWTSCSEVWPSGLWRSKLWNNRNDPTLPSPQTAGSSGSRVAEAAEGKELGSCAHVHLTRWAKAQQQIYEVDVYYSTR